MPLYLRCDEGVQFPLSSVAQPHDLYVNPLGDDNNSGDSLTEPYKTHARALSRISASVIGGYWRIHAAAGTYAENLFAVETLGGARSNVYGNNVVEFIGDELSPANVQLGTSGTIFDSLNCNTAYLFRGYAFVGSGSSTGIRASRAIVFIRNCTFAGCSSPMLLINNSRGTWEPSTTGNTITGGSNAISVASNSFLSIQSSMNFSGQTNTCFLASTTAQTAVSSNLSFTAVSSGALAFAMGQTNGYLGLNGSNNTYNLTGFQYPIRTQTGGTYQGGINCTFNLTNCNSIGWASEYGRWADPGSATVYNRLGTTPALFYKADVALVFSNTIQAAWFRQVASTASLGIDYKYRQPIIAQNVGTLPTSATRYFVGNALNTSYVPCFIVDKAGFLESLRVIATANGSNTDTYTVVVNGVDTALTCSITNGTTGTDLITNISVAVGDTVGFKVVSDTATTAANPIVQCMLRYA